MTARSAGSGSAAERAGSLDPGWFRQVMGRFATGVAVLTAREGGHDHAMTASTFTSVSLEPLLVLACVEVESRFHEAIAVGGALGATVLTENQRALASWFATRGRPLHGQLDRAPHHRGVSGVALLDGGLATVEARIVAIHGAGDHSIVVGAVLAAELGVGDEAALLHYRGQFARLE